MHAGQEEAVAMGWIGSTPISKLIFQNILQPYQLPRTPDGPRWRKTLVPPVGGESRKDTLRQYVISDCYKQRYIPFSLLYELLEGALLALNKT